MSLTMVIGMIVYLSVLLRRRFRRE